MKHHEIQALLFGLAILLACTRIFGEIARKFNQPAVLGEILAGALLGPSVFGKLAPVLQGTIYPLTGAMANFRQGFELFAVGLFLLAAGMEVDLRSVWRQGRTASSVAAFGLVIPFGLGLTAAWFFPEQFGRHLGADPTVFALFIGIALSISALPVIARTLLDLELFRTDMGMIIVASATVEDVIGWIAFAVVLAMMNVGSGIPPYISALSTIAFVVGMLTIGRWVVHRILILLQAYASWPAGALGFIVSYALLCAAITESFGIHAIFGTFFAGVTIGASRHLREKTRSTIENFVGAILAPLFFGGIGLKVDFVSNFDAKLTLAILLIACAGKLLGAGIGATVAGMGRRESAAISFGLNARGSMEIILGLLALQNHIIDERLFVSLVIMALFTSMISGPAMQFFLRRTRQRHFWESLAPHGFVRGLHASSHNGAIVELAEVAARDTGLNAKMIEAAVVEREDMMPTGLPNGLAVPHAYITGLKAPLIVVGTSEHGIDFNAPDGSSSVSIFLILTPEGADPSIQDQLIADISRTFRATEMRDRVGQIRTYTEFMALSRTGAAA